MIEESVKIGKRIKLARTYADLTQDELAEKMSFERGVIQRMEKGQRKVDLQEIKRIAEITGKSVEFFTEDEPEIKIATNHSQKIRDYHDLSDEALEAIDKLAELLRKK
ncbi:MAG: helix-turn-helix domain-containing protein [Actinobacteria bacterium]|nr:helix-turn-helix domain-containing protein [Actinomycetota bacterium]